jgi:hypothetical protein
MLTSSLPIFFSKSTGLLVVVWGFLMEAFLLITSTVSFLFSGKKRMYFYFMSSNSKINLPLAKLDFMLFSTEYEVFIFFSSFLLSLVITSFWGVLVATWAVNCFDFVVLIVFKAFVAVTVENVESLVTGVIGSTLGFDWDILATKRHWKSSFEIGWAHCCFSSSNINSDGQCCTDGG